MLKSENFTLGLLASFRISISDLNTIMIRCHYQLKTILLVLLPSLMMLLYLTMTDNDLSQAIIEHPLPSVLTHRNGTSSVYTFTDNDLNKRMRFQTGNESGRYTESELFPVYPLYLNIYLWNMSNVFTVSITEREGG